MVNSVGEEKRELVAGSSVQGANWLLTIKCLHGIAVVVFTSKSRSGLGVTRKLVHVGSGICRGGHFDLMGRRAGGASRHDKRQAGEDTFMR